MGQVNNEPTYKEDECETRRLGLIRCVLWRSHDIKSVSFHAKPSSDCIDNGKAIGSTKSEASFGKNFFK